jgi:hypothetical protein
MSALVLVENEVTYGGQYDHWQGLIGVSYHFPNQYRNKIHSGRRFIYYRGIRRAQNQRGQAEYFGVGCIASLWRDPAVPMHAPKARWHWFCSIENYIPFLQPVPAKIDGVYLENITRSLGWRTAVREISDEMFARILALAGLKESVTVPLQDVTVSLAPLPAPALDAVVPIELPSGLDSLLQPHSPARQPVSDSTTVSYRRTRQAKQVGDRAEEVVIKWLQTKLGPTMTSSITWVAAQGKTPGWDIEFRNAEGALIAVEVKGTTGDVFQSVEITAQEREAAKEKRDKYWLVLVTACLHTQPKVSVVRDPFSLFVSGHFQIEPILWGLRRAEGPNPL